MENLSLLCGILRAIVISLVEGLEKGLRKVFVRPKTPRRKKNNRGSW